MKILKKDLKQILELLKSKDYESRCLGYGLYQESDFRKYIRNKVYCFKDDKDITRYFKFPLYSLHNLSSIKEDFLKENLMLTNETRISNAAIIINLYLKNKIIIVKKCKS